MSAPDALRATVPSEAAGERVDRVLAGLFPDYSRARIQAWIRDGRATLDGRAPSPSDRVSGGEHAVLHPEPPAATARWEASPGPVPVVHEDDDLIVVDKPAGLVVHPGAGNPGDTLVNRLLHHDPGLAALPRAGLVHRLDKDTSGLLAVARSERAHRALTAALERHAVERGYEAVVNGVLSAGGRVDAPIGRHRAKRTRMAVRSAGRRALTHYRVLARFRAHTHVRLALETGRTHQIRVHMAHIDHPLVGDPTYGGRPRFPRGAGEALRAVLGAFRRQALHAARLALDHPAGGRVAWSSPLPADLRALVEALAADAAEHADG